MDPKLYAQCELEQVKKADEPGRRSYVAWIPKEFGKTGKVVSIDGMEGDWKVVNVFATKDSEFIDQQRMSRQRFDKVLEGH